MTTPRAARRLEIVEELVTMAGTLDVSLARYATAWTLRHPAVTSAIIGPRIVSQLDDSLRACEVKIPDAHAARIDALVPPGANV